MLAVKEGMMFWKATLRTVNGTKSIGGGQRLFAATSSNNSRAVLGMNSPALFKVVSVSVWFLRSEPETKTCANSLVWELILKQDCGIRKNETGGKLNQRASLTEPVNMEDIWGFNLLRL